MNCCMTLILLSFGKSNNLHNFRDEMCVLVFTCTMSQYKVVVSYSIEEA